MARGRNNAWARNFSITAGISTEKRAGGKSISDPLDPDFPLAVLIAHTASLLDPEAFGSFRHVHGIRRVCEQNNYI
jgi:hypothetical protein